MPKPSPKAPPAKRAAARRSTVAIDDAADNFDVAARAASTLHNYAGDWSRFSSWCAAAGRTPLPAEPVVIRRYLSELALAGKKPSTIERAFVSICHHHVEAGHPSPRTEAALKTIRSGIRRSKGTAPTQKKAIRPLELRAAIKAARGNKERPATAVLRDRALLLLGFACASRRSELVAIDVEDVAFTDEGLRVLLKRAKTDQEGAGRAIGVPPGGNEATCPVRAVRAWLETLEAAGVAPSGPLFRRVRVDGKIGRDRLSDRAVALIVKRAAQEAGVDPTHYAGHSLRAGLVTAAVRAGKSFPSIMKQTGHKSAQMVARYAREAELFEDNAAEGVGL